MEKIKFSSLLLKGAYIIEPLPFIDERGMFARIFCKREFEEKNLMTNFVQINHSLTKKKGSIRGMHFQFPPYAEIKIIKCLKGSVFDVVIDLRKDSPTFLQWHGEILSAENMKAFYVPKGFAHGFQTLEDDCELLYLHSELYTPSGEGAIRYDDPKINIKWPSTPTEISEKDQIHPFIDEKFKGIEI